ncbi:NAD(P)/FAD-dependent oxidoreductase [Chryseobacterium sp. ERMR1:04]|uniref:NAD(P)/FAD-dependent oxidoreductase n=1 Tax=Chryseobacterium sp. ERMR1:04 TaxID=1705393 RepID=UPI0006C8C84C|nr:NAD(P)/FAD-dependent oxidoreductase [Chryseobacterium sp. ERMR1:04]KPH14237.1 hypothetical protein AMQ68_01585 [Chryseobacterium sp. ERMR1:04]
MSIEYDIGIVGAGPAGCIAAIELQKLGYKVLLVEKSVFPRFHIGFSCSPGLFHWLDVLNLRDQIAPAILGNDSKTALLWEESQVITKENHGVSVDRGMFDQLLSQYASRLGVKIIQPVNKLQLQENKDHTWTLFLQQDHQDLQFKVRFFVEATGRKSIIKTTKVAYLPPLNATYTFLPASFKHSIIEAGENGWFWGTPYKEKCLLAYFGNPSHIKSFNTVAEYLNDGLKQLKTVNLEIPQALQVFSCNASSYYDQNPVSLDHIKIGDSAYTTDPISSQGVVKAIKTAVHASKVVHTILNRSEDAETAIDYYENLIHTDVVKNTQWINTFYSKQQHFDSSFWRQYKLPSPTPLIQEQNIQLQANDLLIINPAIIFKNTSVLGSDFIEQRQGIQLNAHENPFVFIDQILIVDLLKEVHQKSVKDIINFLYRKYTQVNPKDLFQYLISNRLLVKF